MERGYDGEHERLRARWAPLVAAGQVDCHAARCLRWSRRILPGAAWDLGHTPDRSGWTGPEHPACNRSEGAARGNRRRGSMRQSPVKRRRIEVDYTAAGVEITQDRTRTWIALAGRGDDGRVVVDLLDPVQGTDAVAPILALRGAHPVAVIALDPRSAAATLIAGLQNENMPLLLPDSSQLAVAFGRFLDETTAGKLRHRGHRALTDAVREAAARRTAAGAQAVDRSRGADPAPLVAAELAVWALLEVKRLTPFFLLGNQ